VALLLQVLYSVRSERMLIGATRLQPVVRWFVGLNMDDSDLGCGRIHENRQCLLAATSPTLSSQPCLSRHDSENLLSDEHFTVDGTLLEAWAGQKSFRHVRR